MTVNKYKIEHAIFKPISRFQRCYSCFRCVGEHEYDGGLFAIRTKPDLQTPVKCISACSPEINGNRYHKACEYWMPRWYWNMRMRNGRLCYELRDWWRVHIRTKIGALRPPVELEWIDSYNCVLDSIIPNGEPRCPHCGEMPYSHKQCVFCGQRFLQKIQPNEGGQS